MLGIEKGEAHTVLWAAAGREESQVKTQPSGCGKEENGGQWQWPTQPAEAEV